MKTTHFSRAPRRALAALVICLGASAAAHAATDLARIKANVASYTNGAVQVEQLRATPIPGIYEGVAQGEVFYTDATGRYGFVGGSLMDMKTQTDLTSPAVERESALPFEQLPLDLAVKQVNGAGTRTLAVFEDPNCPICRVFTQFLDQVDDVTIYRFMYPLISPESMDLARTAWCSADRDGAWKDLMKGQRFGGTRDCDVSGLARILQFGEAHNIDATPTVFLTNGKRLVGATPPEQFLAELDASPQANRRAR